MLADMNPPCVFPGDANANRLGGGSLSLPFPFTLPAGQPILSGKRLARGHRPASTANRRQRDTLGLTVPEGGYQLEREHRTSPAC